MRQLSSHRPTVPAAAMGLYSLSGRTSYRKISWSLEAARLGFRLFQSLWILTGTSAATLARCLSNFRAIRSLWHPISLRDFARFGGKTSSRLVNIGPGLFRSNWVNIMATDAVAFASPGGQQHQSFKCREMMCNANTCMPSQMTYDVKITSLLRQNDVATSFWRHNDVIIRSRVHWVQNNSIPSCPLQAHSPNWPLLQITLITAPEHQLRSGPTCPQCLRLTLMMPSPTICRHPLQKREMLNVSPPSRSLLQPSGGQHFVNESPCQLIAWIRSGINSNPGKGSYKLILH